MKRRSNAKKIATGAILAGVAGYVAGLLSAPKSGRQLRTDLKDKAPEGAHDAVERLKFLADELNELLVSAKEESKGLGGKHKEKFEFAQSKAVEAKDKLETLLEAIKSGNTADKELNRAMKEAEKAVVHFKDFLLKK